MNTLILLLPGKTKWSPETWASQHGGQRRDDGLVMIEGSSGWLSVMRDDLVLNDYETHERAALAAMLTEPVPFLVEWKGSDLLETLLRAVPSDAGAVVDNDHGILLPIREIHGLPIESWISAERLL